MMKSYKELMSEGKVDPNFIKKFLKDIDPFLKEIGGLENVDKYVLYRGVGNFKDTIKTVRKNRSPKDTDKVLHTMLDEWFFDAFNHKHRSSSVFTTGDIEVAEGYGQVVAIFPIGKFSIAWSDKVYDLSISLSDTRNKLISNLVPKKYKNSLVRANAKLNLEEMGYVIGDGVEEFVKIHFDTKAQTAWKKTKQDKKKKFWEEFIFNVEEELREQMNKWKYTDKNLKKAIMSGNEVQIATDKYYVMSHRLASSPFNVLKDNNTTHRNGMLANLKKYK